MHTDDKLSNYEILNSLDDPLEMDPYRQKTFMELVNTPTPTTPIADVLKTEVKPKEKPTALTNKMNKINQRVATNKVVAQERIKKDERKFSEAHNVMRKADALDKRIKSSKSPSYEDLQEFHRLSQQVESLVK